ncbi:MAG: hypothetical protein RLZ98_1769 [Pseudomonadota bacterium]|jgi:4,5-dihydroxyphthalate decarboxylase
MTLSLDIAVADNPFVADLKSGEIPIEGCEPSFRNIKPQIAAYRMMVREVAFDVCELAPTTYLIARAHGCPIIALPIFLMRRFHHAGVKVNPAAGIGSPKDLEGRKVGVRAYSVTTGVWTRAILMEEYGLDSSKVTWVVDDEEHVQQLQLPANVEHVPEGSSLYRMFVDGELAAGLDANAGIGRSGDPFSGWKEEDVSMYPELFPNAAELEADWYARTGIYPIHGTVVVKEALIRDNPWLGPALMKAFKEGKARWLAGLASASDPTSRKYREYANIVGPDPLPFGIEANRPSIEALHRAALDQKLIPRPLTMAEMFVDVPA